MFCLNSSNHCHSLSATNSSNKIKAIKLQQLLGGVEINALGGIKSQENCKNKYSACTEHTQKHTHTETQTDMA